MKALIVLATISLAILGYTYGFVSTQMGLFPHAILDEAWKAARAYKYAWEQSLTPPTFVANVEDPTVAGALPVIDVLDETAVADSDGLFLMQGGWYRLTSHCPEYGCAAWLMDRRGEIVFTWPMKENVPWEELPDREGFAIFENIYPTGIQLLESGDLILAYQGRNTFPFGIGIARLDQNGDVVWKSDRAVHHWLEMGDDDLIYAPAHRLLDSPYRIGDTNKLLTCDEGKIYDDLVLVYDLDGNIQEEFSLLEVLVNSGYPGLLRGTVAPCDPLHLNYIDVLEAADAGEFPDADAGDLLVSLLSIDTIALIDRDTRRIKWISSGQVVAQHNAVFYKDNKIMAFDNQGGHHRRGGSRLVTIDLATQELETLYPTDDVPPDERFYTRAAGHFMLSDDKRRALISLTMDGLVHEHDLETGQIIWKYDNVFDMTVHPDTAENGNLDNYSRYQTGGTYYVGRPAFLDSIRQVRNQ